MKIVLFTESYDCGGVDTFIVNLINNWPTAEDEFVVIANTNYPGLDIIEKEIVRRQVKIVRAPTRSYTNFIGSIQEGHKFLALCIRAFSPVTRYLFLLYNVFALRRVIFGHNPDTLMVINGGYPGGDSCQAATICWGLFGDKRRSVHTVHSLAARTRFWVFFQETITDYIVSSCADRIISVSKASADSMRSRPAINDAKVSYIHNGSAMIQKRNTGPDVNIRMELGIHPSSPLCLMLGSYDTLKGHDFLLKSFKRVLRKIRSAHLLICGYGLPGDIARVSGLVAGLGLNESVHLLRFRPDAMNFLSQADVLLVSSQAYESFGFTSVEAMLQRIPVVATAVGGIPEVVVNNEGGYCVPKDDLEGYSDRIIELLSDAKLRQEQGRKGFERANRLFTAKVMAEKYYELLSPVKNA